MALSAEGFEKLLSALDGDRDAAGEQYQLVRLKLVKFFELRMCANPDELADETIDRVARRLAQGEQIEASEAMRYVYGVARNVLLEWWKSERRHHTIRFPSATGDDVDTEQQGIAAERQLHCFRECLSGLSEHSRRLLLRYYEHAGRTKIDARISLAKELGIPLNALRIRVHRIKSDLQRCMEKCIAGPAHGMEGDS